MSILTVRRVAHALIGHSQVTANVVNLICFAAAGLLAFLLRFDLSVPKQYQGYLLVGLAVWVPVKGITFACLRLDRGWWRYASVSDIVRVAYGNVVGSAVATVILLLVSPPGFPRSVYILDFVLCLGITAGARLVVRLAVEFSRVSGGSIKKRTLIYGAGDAGVSLLREIHSNRSLAYEVVGFVDDDPKKTGGVIHRAKVFGGGSALAGVVTTHSVDMVLIALPSATGPEMTRVLRHCQDAGVAFKTVPGLAEVIEGKALTTQIRDVAVEDLLGRTPAVLEHGLIAAKVTGRMVMVSGAAGSIGSEMCRQIARFDPAGIVGFEIGETALFQLEREMRQSFPGVPFHAEIGSIQNRQRIAEVLEQYRPAVVFHAAAYKHVPMMEAHAFEAVENNVFGTLNLALEAARRAISDQRSAIRKTSF